MPSRGRGAVAACGALVSSVVIASVLNRVGGEHSELECRQHRGQGDHECDGESASEVANRLKNDWRDCRDNLTGQGMLCDAGLPPGAIPRMLLPSRHLFPLCLDLLFQE